MTRILQRITVVNHPHSMKKIILLLFFTGAAFMVNAQMNWNVSYRNKAVFKKITENVAKNNFTIAKSNLSKPGSLILTLNSADTAYNITLMADDENRSGIKSWENITRPVTISNADLKGLFADKKTIHFYYTSIPKDPEKAMLVRMRPVHICTVVLK
jgi:hypothetical protein